LTNDQKLLTEQWVQAYKKVPEKSVEKIKQEVNMSFTATTITEHYLNEGKIKGKIEGKIENIEELYRFGILSKEQMEKMIEPLKQQLQSLESSEKKHIH
jgi:hypothetical protein